MLALNPLVFDVTKGPEQHGYTFGDVPLNSHEDRYGLHAALAAGDPAPLFEHIPEAVIASIADQCVAHGYDVLQRGSDTASRPHGVRTHSLFGAF